MDVRDTGLDSFWDRPLRDLLEALQATPAGLTSEEATRRARRYGANSLMRESRFAGLSGFLRFLANPLVISAGFAWAAWEGTAGTVRPPPC